MSRWVLLIHGDSDGVVSGALAYAYLAGRGFDVDIYFTHPAGLAEDLRSFAELGDNVFIADIALSEKHLGEIESLFRRYSEHGRLLYIDHHPEPLSLKPRDLWGEIIHDTCCSASELVYRYFSERGLSREYERVALYGAIGDYLDETPWVKKALLDWDKRSVYFEAGILVQGLEGSRKEYDFKRRIVRLLARNMLPSSDSRLVLKALEQSIRDEELRIRIKSMLKVKGLVSYVVDPGGSLGRAANYARIYGGTPIGLACEIRDTKCVASLRSVSVDLNLLLRRITPLIDGTGGGHPYAAGARFPRDRLDEFIDLINREAGKLL